MSQSPYNSNNNSAMLPPNKSEQHSEMPDLSNPYMYPSNPIASTKEQNYPLTNSTFNHAQSSDVDPELTRFKSLFWKKAGELQSTLGSLTGLTSWQQSGEKTREEAEREHKEAQERLGHGEASRIHGEYDRLMGYVTYAVGHVAGDNEMQMKANERTERGAAEINRSLHS